MQTIVSLLLILLVTGAGGRSHANLAAAVAVTPPRTMAPNLYWQAVLPDTPMPLAINDMLLDKSTECRSRDDMNMVRDEKAHTMENCHSQIPDLVKIPRKIGHNSILRKEIDRYVPDENQKFIMLKGVKNPIVVYGLQDEENSRKITTSYGTHVEDDLRKITMANEFHGEQDTRKISISYGTKFGHDLSKIRMSYGSQDEEDSKKAIVSYGFQDEEHPKKILIAYGPQYNKDQPKTIVTTHGFQEEEDSKKATTSYGSQYEKDPKKLTISYGSQDNKKPTKTIVTNGFQDEEDPRKRTMIYGSRSDEDSRKNIVMHGSQGEEDQRKITLTYGSHGVKEDPRETIVTYGPHVDEEPKKTVTYEFYDEHDSKNEAPTNNNMKVSMSFGPEDKHKSVIVNRQQTEASATSKGDRHAHIHSDNNKMLAVADVFFFHDALRPGSVITPTIPPTTSLPALLPRHIADSLPFSTKRFADIIAMFDPPSLAMAREMRWTLDTCENPRPLPGEKVCCADSLESLVDVPAALLGTHNVRAFSADMPTDPAGTPARRNGTYNVTAVRKLSESPEIATCHDLTYPYAVFFCHTSNPAIAYGVTLEATGEGATPSSIEVLAVCHLDTSQWSSRNPFFVVHNLKPGDAAACHFLSKLSIVWVPADAV